MSSGGNFKRENEDNMNRHEDCCPTVDSQCWGWLVMAVHQARGKIISKPD